MLVKKKGSTHAYQVPGIDRSKTLPVVINMESKK